VRVLLADCRNAPATANRQTAALRFCGGEPLQLPVVAFRETRPHARTIRAHHDQHWLARGAKASAMTEPNNYRR
jgi:hypothetical protein